MVLLLLITVFSVVVFALNQKSENKWRRHRAIEKAMLVAYGAALAENIATEKLSYGHSGGKVEDKVSFVEILQLGSSDFIIR
ncbi:MAG: hypothetical protein IPM85_02760 [Chitinophagaceae bacterium]|nr:hypothetical protein [Chitinophagaceae bacterium]